MTGAEYQRLRLCGDQRHLMGFLQQPDNALRLQRLGVGDSLPPPQFNATNVAQKLHALLGSAEVRRRCEQLRVQCSHDDAIAKACNIMECFAEERTVMQPVSAH